MIVVQPLVSAIKKRTKGEGMRLAATKLFESDTSMIHSGPGRTNREVTVVTKEAPPWLAPTGEKF